MRIKIQLLLVLLPILLCAQNNKLSYVMTRTMTNSSASAWLDHIEYDTGLGLVMEQVDVGITPSGNTLMSLIEYDSHQRPVRQWLPAVFSDASWQSADKIKQSSRTLASDNKPYTQTAYDVSIQSRMKEVCYPGSDWHDYNKVCRYETKSTNGDPKIKILGFDVVANYTFFNYNPQDGSYKIECEENEDGEKKYTYIDGNGNLAAIRHFSNNERHTTYYVYNDYGDLRFVLPPEAAHYYENNQCIAPDYENDMVPKLCYEYRYDDRHNCIYKQLPGCEPIYYIYDKADRCIFSQNGEQRKRGEWSFTIPDIFGRTVLTGICMNSLDYTKEPIRNLVIHTSRDNTEETSGYRISGTTLQNAKIYSVSYYDDYTFIGKNKVPDALKYTQPTVGYGTQGLLEPKGLLTGTITARLTLSGVNGYDYASLFYDDKGQVIQKRSTNHLGGYDYEYFDFDFTGNVLKHKHIHQAASDTPQTEEYIYSYDHAGRLLTTRYKLNSDSEVLLHQNTYDEVGRLISKTNGSTNGMTETYSYNVRSWPTTISAGSLFSENLYYNESYGGNTPQYGGNISAMTWKADGKTRGYKFSYDRFSRLLKADYMENGNASTRYSTEYTYDKMGNLLTLKRNGKQDGGTYGLIDNLTFTYNGNQVTKIEDAVTDPTYNGVFNFMDGASQNNEYTYDENGNLTKDLNKNISLIQYNLLNLPTSITYSNGKSAAYIYDASGKKLRTSYKASPSAAVQQTDYCGNMIYENNVLKQILIDGGYITFNGSTPQYHYYLKDHLGNNRVVCSASGSVEQVNHYYPFGGLFGESTGGDTQRYKYNGKELDRMHGLDWYDYGARHMDGMRFTTIDPLAGDYYSISPYAYCANNPINAIDPDGRKVYVFSTKLPSPYKKVRNSGATHTFTVVKTQDGREYRFAYGPTDDDFFHSISGTSPIVERNYDQDKNAVENYFSTGMDDNIKEVISVNAPNGISETDFDNAVIKSASVFRDNKTIMYRILPIGESEGNCNSSTTSLLKNAGVNEKEIKRIESKLSGIHIGFGTDKPWTKEQRVDAEVHQKEIRKMNESLSNHIGF